MIFLPKMYQTIFVILLLTFSSHMAFAAEPSPKPKTLHLTGHVEYVNTQGGFFAIVGDDGLKYQPTNLPPKVRTNGLPIKFNATINDHIVSSFIWGTIVDVSNVAPLKFKTPDNERSAIYVLQKRMDAFNRKDLGALQQIDTLAKSLTTEQFNNWIGNYSNYTLQYVDISSADSYALTGACYYTRELLGEKRADGNIELSATTFTISKTKDGWKLTKLAGLKNPNFTNKETLLADLKQKAMEKYKTNQLATLLQ